MPESNEFDAQLRLEIDNLDELVERLSKALARAPDDLSKGMSAIFDRVVDDAKTVRKALDVSKTEKDFRNVESAMRRTAREASKVAKALSTQRAKTSILDAGSIDRTAQALNRLSLKQSEVNKKITKTSLASQNVIRIVQDAPFGLFGVANNIEQVAESFSRLLASEGSVRKALSKMFLPLFTGPMAIPLVISIVTALALSWDKLAAQIDNAKVALGLMTDAQREFNKVVRAAQEGEFSKRLIASLDLEEAAGALVRTNAELSVMRARLDALLEPFGVESFDDLRAAVLGGSLDADIEDIRAIRQLDEEVEAIEERAERLRTRIFTIGAERAARRELGLPADPEEEGRRKKEEEDARKRAEEARRKREALEEKHQSLLAQLEKKGANNRLRQLEVFEQEKLNFIRREFANEKDLRDSAIDALSEFIANERSRLARVIVEEAAEEERKEEERQQREREKRALEQERELAKAIQEERAAIRRRERARIFGIQQSEELIFGQDPDSQRQRAAESLRIFKEVTAARIASINELLEVSRLAQDEFAELIAERDNLQSEIERREAEHQQKLTDIARDEQKKRLQDVTGLANTTATIFGEMATVAGREGEKGFEQNKALLKAQAFAQAIAAGVAATRVFLESAQGPGAIAQAIAAGLAVFTTLASRIRQIDNVDASGSGAGTSGGFTGRFTALNSQVVAQRARDFDAQQRRIQVTAGARSAEESTTKIVNAVEELRQGLQDQRVVIDDRTAMDVTRLGNKRSARLTRTTR